jgi:hypothetical protein
MTYRIENQSRKSAAVRGSSRVRQLDRPMRERVFLSGGLIVKTLYTRLTRLTRLKRSYSEVLSPSGSKIWRLGPTSIGDHVEPEGRPTPPGQLTLLHACEAVTCIALLAVTSLHAASRRSRAAAAAVASCVSCSRQSEREAAGGP